MARLFQGRPVAFVGCESRRNVSNVSAEVVDRLERHERPAGAFPGFHTSTLPGKPGIGDSAWSGQSEATRSLGSIQRAGLYKHRCEGGKIERGSDL